MEQFGSFKLASEVNRMEDFIWNAYNMTSCYSGSLLGDRLQFLTTFGSISRSECGEIKNVFRNVF